MITFSSHVYTCGRCNRTVRVAQATLASLVADAREDNPTWTVDQVVDQLETCIRCVTGKVYPEEDATSLR